MTDRARCIPFEPADQSKAVVFLASDETCFAVGSELIVDGGLSL